MSTLRSVNPLAASFLGRSTKSLAPFPLKLYDSVITQIREHCRRVHPGLGNLNLRACEDPENVVMSIWGENVDDIYTMPVSQTEQLAQEIILATHPDIDGVYTIGTSSRDEPKLDPARHLRKFPIVEVEKRGTFDDMLEWQSSLLQSLGYPSPVIVDYRDFAAFRGVKVLSNDDEAALSEVAEVVQLIKFPEKSHPFFNMKWDMDIQGRFAWKCDVIIDGVETFGSAARETRPDVMREMFLRSVNGKFAHMLYDKFGEDDIKKEIDDYIELIEPDFERFGMGIGLTRLMASYAARRPEEYPVGCTNHGVWKVAGE